MGEGKREMTLRLLDLENLKVVTRKYRWVKRETVKVGGRSIPCTVVDFEDEVKKCRRWVKENDRRILIVRQDGAGGVGSYSLRIRSAGGSSAEGGGAS